jgi:hypothetical protein
MKKGRERRGGRRTDEEELERKNRNVFVERKAGWSYMTPLIKIPDRK